MALNLKEVKKLYGEPRYWMLSKSDSYEKKLNSCST